MPDVRIRIGGREFEVACQAGEEHYLRSAAAMLDAEATALTNQIGRLPESRMLLMAGLMLADKTAGLEDQMRTLEEKLAAQQTLIEELRANGGVKPQPVEVPVIPPEVKDSLADLAGKAEALADLAEQKAREAAAG